MPPLLEWTQQSMLESASCSRLADRLGSMIMEFFSQPGSFVWDSLRAPLNLDNVSTVRTIPVNVFQPAFCTWFCVYEKAQSILSRNDDIDASTKMMSSIWVLGEKQMRTQSRSSAQEKFSLRNASFLLSHLARAYRLVTTHTYGFTSKCTATHDEVAQILFRYLQRCDANEGVTEQMSKKESGFDKEILDAMIKKMGELVLMINNFQDTSRAETTMTGNDITQGMFQMILDMNHVAAKQVEHWTRRWIYVNPLMKWMALQDPSLQKKVDRDTESQSTTLNIRRDVVAGLDPAAQKMLGVLQDQMTITKDDWFRAFGGTMEEYCVGLWTLQMIGLVQPKKGAGGGGSKDMYEKVSVVWC
ncbi:MAG: hypothetical protein SGILL_009832 [Bacillariaceae sp.]